MRQIAFATAGIIIVSVVSYVLANLEPAAPIVEAGTVWEDTVKRGPMVRDVRGLGTLVPEDIRWIPATTQGRVERIVLRPGTPVKPDSVILELSNPQLEQELVNAELQLQSTEASQANLRVQVQNELLSQRATAASIEADFKRAEMQVQMNEALAKDQLISQLQLRQSQLDSQQLSVRHKIAQEQLESRADSGRAQLAVQQAAVDQARAVVELRRRERDELKVRAGIDGVLQLIPVEIADGARVAPGANLARVANPSRLKAEIKVAETQARDIQVGQRAEIDTRIAKVQGRVVRIDPYGQNGTRTVDVSLDGELPRGAVPDLSVDGKIILEELDDVIFVGRPAFGADQAVVSLFKKDIDGTSASRVQVKLGRTSVNTVEVVEGLSVGDKVILSDMSAWESFDRVRLR